MSARVLVLGSGFVGTYVGLRLERKARRGEVDVTLVSPDSFMTYHPFLPEAASGNIEPRHVVVPLRSALRKTRIVTGRVEALDHERRLATVVTTAAEKRELGYDHVVIGVGSVSRTLPVPGLAERGIGFKTIEEAIALRNRLLANMDAADASSDETFRRRALTFVFVGGGYSGVEALAELEDLATWATRYYPNVKRADMRWVLVEATGTVLPEIGRDLAGHALEVLQRRGIEVHLNTELVSAEDGVMELSDGTSFEADTLVWTAGVRPNPVVARLGMPLDERERVVTDAALRVAGVPGAWAAGDCAAVPDLTGSPGATTPPTAQHSLRQAVVLADNLLATLRGDTVKDFRYRSLGGIVSLGRHRGVARVPGVNLRGLPAWFLHRTYHLLRIPTLGRKARVLADWTVALFFKRDLVQLGGLQRPREPFERALGDTPTERA